MQLTTDILDEARGGDFTRLRRVAKSDLHAHSVLSAPLATYERLSGNVFPNVTRFESLHHFLKYIAQHYIPVLSSEESNRVVLRDCLAQMIADGVGVCELSFDLSIPKVAGSTWSSMASIFRQEIEAVQGRITVRPELGLAREHVPENWRALVEEAISTELFSGIDLYGDETARPIEYFSQFFGLARRRNLRVKIHSGEIGDVSRVEHEIRFVHPDGVQHGIHAVRSPALMQFLAAENIPLHVCPWSNYLLRCVEHYESHPIRELFDAGVTVTLNTDDFGVFHRSLSEEYLALYQAGIFSASELEQIRRNGLPQQ